MDRLPDEVLIEILDYLEHEDVVSAQRISPRLLKLARDNTLWKLKCFEKAPSAAKLFGQPSALPAYHLIDISPSESRQPVFHSENATFRASRRARVAADWDCSDTAEDIDWYSEYIARHAPLHTKWHVDKSSTPSEVRGLAALHDGTRAIGSLEDGSLAIWDISWSGMGDRSFQELGRAARGTLFNATTPSWLKPLEPKVSFSNVTDCVTVNSSQNKAYVAVGRLLNEVDLEKLEIVSQHEYAWPITALSQETSFELPLTVGTTWSLNLYDPRVPIRDRSRSPEDMLRARPSDPEDSIAFFPNYTKDPILKARFEKSLPPTFPGFRIANSDSPNPRDPTLSQDNPRGREASDFAYIEPGPLSIVHHKSNDILVAGRFPSILSYDRRYFPRLEHVIHSGSRLSYLAVIPFAPIRAGGDSSADATIVACGEYGGRGSLELYSLPHVKESSRRRTEDYGLMQQDNNEGAIDREHAFDQALGEVESPFSYKNRQEASSSKLLAVATQGARIVFSDAEGGLKWVERDGRGLVRRWNINKYELTPQGGSVQGEQVVRKIIPLPSEASERGTRGDSDLLVWTGESCGIVTTKAARPEDELADELDERLNLNDEEGQAEEYAKTMRRALERQADERRWMTRFRLR